ncbi:MAG: sulfatase [Chthoniobacter sp.]|nr:sulfatase [Chthoniobacter sp.]
MKTISFPLLALVLLAVTARAAEKPTRPNILVIFSDDHASHALSCYGSKINTTPNLDRIAAGGMRFTNAFVTNSICTPSRATLMTGKYSHINGVPVFNTFDGAQPTVAKYLQAAGYHTGMIGKWHLGSDPTGFDYWSILPGQGRYHDPEFIEMGVKKVVKGYVSDIIADQSLAFLETRPKDKPFLLFSNPKAPHRPWEPDARHAHMYDDIDIPEPATFGDDYASRSSAASEATMRIDRDLTNNDTKGAPPAGLEGLALKKWKYQRYMKDYLRCVASMDDNVGRMLDYLEKNQLMENTVIIYASDNGFYLGDHNWFDKRFMYEFSLRVPLLVKAPGLTKPGAVSERIVQNTDFAPTIMDLAGLPVPADMQGRSLAPVLRGEPPADWRTAMYYRYYHYPQDHRVQPHYGVRTAKEKLIYFNKINAWEFYDLAKDPDELHNLIEDPAAAPRIEAMKKELARVKAEAKDDDRFADQVPGR